MKTRTIKNVSFISLFAILFMISGCEKDEGSPSINITGNWNVHIINEDFLTEEAIIVSFTQENNELTAIMFSSSETAYGEVTGTDINFTMNNDSIGKIDYTGTIIDEDTMVGIRGNENSSISEIWEAKSL